KQKQHRLRERCKHPHAITPVTDEIALPDDVDRPHRGAANVHRACLRNRRSRQYLFGHRRPPPHILPKFRIVSSDVLPCSRMARPVSLRNTSSRLGRRALTALIGTLNSEKRRGMNDAESATSTCNVPSTCVDSRCITRRSCSAATAVSGVVLVI